LLLEQAGARNVRVVARDAAEVMPQRLADASFSAVDLFFPVPWPKKRQDKRRLVQPACVAEIARVLKPSGIFHVATDWADYARHTREVLAQSEALVPVEGGDMCHNPLALRPPTKFERRGRRLGHDVVDLFYRKR
jgi:tRNA (guanine-N7-)-methyltransferase